MNVRIGLECMMQGRESGTVMQLNGSDLVGIPFLSTAHKVQQVFCLVAVTLNQQSTFF